MICWLLAHTDIEYCSGWSSGCAFPSAPRRVTGRISLVGIGSIGLASDEKVHRCCWDVVWVIRARTAELWWLATARLPLTSSYPSTTTHYFMPHGHIDLYQGKQMLAVYDWQGSVSLHRCAGFTSTSFPFDWWLRKLLPKADIIGKRNSYHGGSFQQRSGT